MTSPSADESASIASILVVDDDRANHQAIAAMVKGMNLRLTFVSSGEEALAHLLKQDVAAILLDVKMQGMDGFETAKLIRNRPRTRHVPIIFMTAYGPDDSQAKRGYEIGAADYLFKPIVPQILRAKLNVFAELHQRAEAVREQGERLRELERVAHRRELEQERQAWEARTLRQEMAQQKRINDELAELDARKDEFLATLAHELRNPLAALVGNLAVQHQSLDPALLSTHESMKRQVAQLTRLVDDLLDVSRISQGRLELQIARCDLGSVVRQAADICLSTADRPNAELRIQGPDEPIYVEVDAARIIQVIGNLVSNSARYTDEGGAITLEWGAENGQAFVTVADTGKGIDPKVLPRIFDRYVQGANEHGGLGLGLALVKELCEMHRGSVDVHSAGLGEGARFTVRFPQPERETVTQERGKSVRPSQRVGPMSSAQKCTFRIALIEDDEDIRFALMTLLQSWGHHAESARDGESGVELVLRTRPEVALLDLGLPGIDGYEVARRIRHTLGNESPYLIVMSGYGDSKAKARSAKIGIDTHLTKPVEPEVLQRLLNQPLGAPAT